MHFSTTKLAEDRNGREILPTASSSMVQEPYLSENLSLLLRRLCHNPLFYDYRQSFRFHRCSFTSLRYTWFLCFKRFHWIFQSRKHSLLKFIHPWVNTKKTSTFLSLCGFADFPFRKEVHHLCTYRFSLPFFVHRWQHHLFLFNSIGLWYLMKTSYLIQLLESPFLANLIRLVSLNTCLFSKINFPSGSLSLQ